MSLIVLPPPALTWLPHPPPSPPASRPPPVPILPGTRPPVPLYCRGEEGDKVSKLKSIQCFFLDCRTKFLILRLKMDIECQLFCRHNDVISWTEVKRVRHICSKLYILVSLNKARVHVCWPMVSLKKFFLVHFDGNFVTMFK